MDSAPQPATAEPARPEGRWGFTRRGGIFYGWWIVGAAILANYAYAVQFNSNYGVYVYTMGTEMGWSRTALAAVQSLGRLPEAVTAVVVGPFVDRYGARWFIAVGAGLMGIAFLALATVQELWQLYVYRGLLLSVGGICVGGFLSVTVANWFVAKRGRALGLVASGTFLGTATLPPLTALFIEQRGWRASWALQGVLMVLLVVPAVILFRRRPEDVGLRPDGAPPEAAAAGDEHQRRPPRAASTADVIWTRQAALRTSTFWITAVAYGISSMAVTATNLHIVPFLQDLGYPLALAAAGVTVRSSIAMVVGPLWGLAIERLPLRSAQLVPFLLQGTAMLLFFLSTSTPMTVAGLVLYGIGSGGSGVLQESIWAYFFGRLSLGTVRSAVVPIQTLLGAVGPLAMGLAFDLTGSYRRSWLFLMLALFGSGVLVLLARRPPPPPRPSQVREP